MVSLMECILSEGMPRSTVLIPTLADTIGPIVEPQGVSFLTTNSYKENQRHDLCPTNCPYLDGSPRSASNFPQEKAGLSIGGVPLVLVSLDHGPLVEDRLMVLLMFLWVVRVDGVSHVS